MLFRSLEARFSVKAHFVGADLMSTAGVESLIRDAEEKLGATDILVNNAGIQFVSPIEAFPAEKWDAILALNLSAAFHSTRAVFAGMKARKFGRKTESSSWNIVSIKI